MTTAKHRATALRAAVGDGRHAEVSGSQGAHGPGAFHRLHGDVVVAEDQGEGGSLDALLGDAFSRRLASQSTGAPRRVDCDVTSAREFISTWDFAYQFRAGGDAGASRCGTAVSTM